MIVYLASKKEFLEDLFSGQIETIIFDIFKKVLMKSVSSSEKLSWRNSLERMYKILSDEKIPENASIAVEYQIPMTSKRIDLIIAGKNEKKENILIIVELKQWEKVEKTDKDAIVKTYIANAMREVVHPSYQAWSYKSLLEDFNLSIRVKNIQVKPCVYLHNYLPDNQINNNFYNEYIKKAPLFFKSDAKKLKNFILENIVYPDDEKILEIIENSKLAPSKNLADTLVSLIQGNQEFIMIDEQKLVYEKVINITNKNKIDNKKSVIIVEGGPGTGKSVVAINLLVSTIQKGLLSRYVTKNAAPRAVYEAKLSGTLKKSQISNLFTGSGSFVNNEENDYDLLIVDEAHRLNEKSGLFQSIGENQIKEIIHAAKTTVFFIDEDQRVTLKDIGTKDEIKKWANALNAQVIEMELESQFRCNGSDGYIAWLDNVLQIRPTANYTLEGIDYDFKVFDNPNDLKEAIIEKNTKGTNARIVAGYCWDWISKRADLKSECDIKIGEFEMKWNLAKDGSLWIMKPTSINEAGCIHTCQGLEIEYIGVIIGPDLIVRDGKVITRPEKRAKTDASLKGYKTLYKKNPQLAKETADKIIKNTYKTLMSRGSKGCYIFCVDEETLAYFKDRVGLK
ncbi:DUF2075 domain-containing protein [Nitrosophilus kaiyonis]|uniref:DUF2075 domain-containing protein n=1 Tax=Nitrosophilus kaiyonis TaxID=2930200 RepID=UPI0024920F7C|nr:DUF2075 domain-containing protein [Nitrosophilus kaiyonis]